jgi:transposase
LYVNTVNGSPFFSDAALIPSECGTSCGTLVNEAKAVLRRLGLALPTERDVRQVLSSREVERLPAEEKVILACAAQQLAQVEAAIAAVEGAIAQQVGHERGVRLLRTIRGVGLVTAAVIWAALGAAGPPPAWGERRQPWWTTRGSA